jgi:phospholipid/cholesterol/gamma-HCH transport system ATP-binding protein
MIQFQNVVKKFGDRTILKGISFSVEKAEILFILGTSGTGKSVSLKSLVGLLRIDGGEIYIDSQRVDQLSEDDYLPIRKKCGMVFQHPALFDSLSIYENIAFGLRRHYNLEESEVRKKVEECCRLVNLELDVLKKLPAAISYGMQKRVSLARTLAVSPEILLFDEPTTGLDPITTNTVNELIHNLSRKLQTTSIVVSHDMACALDIADKIIVLDGGHIVDQGTPEELKKSEVPLVKDFMQEVLEARGEC